MLLRATGFSLAVLAFAGCRQDMQNQPKYIPLRSGTFFADGRSARLQAPFTVARGQLREDSYFYTGKIGATEGDRLPAEIQLNMDVVRRGQDRFNIFCAPCHSRVGDGTGMIVQRGYKKAGNLLEPRLVKAPLGHFFDVMTNGYGAMPEYASQIPADDRWKIAAYIRALQLSQATGQTASNVPPEMRDKIGNPDAQHPAAGEGEEASTGASQQPEGSK